MGQELVWSNDSSVTFRCPPEIEASPVFHSRRQVQAQDKAQAQHSAQAVVGGSWAPQAQRGGPEKAVHARVRLSMHQVTACVAGTTSGSFRSLVLQGLSAQQC